MRFAPLSTVRRSRSRSPVRRPTSPPPVSDDDDEIDPLLLGKDGFHVGQRVTPARLKNPGKYTDKSMRQVHSKRSTRRERTASLPAVMGQDQIIKGTCVNDFGTIRPCHELVTRLNYRSTYVNRDRLPFQMLFAMLLDEQPDVVRTYNGKLVREYLAGVIGRALGAQDASEPIGWKNLFRFANHTVNILSQVYAMNGDVDPVTVLAERYLQPLMSARQACDVIRSSIRHVENTSELNILQNLQRLVNGSIPPARLWAHDTDSPKAVRSVILRRGQLKPHPWEQLKEDLEHSIELFRSGERNIAMNVRVPDETAEGGERDIVVNVRVPGQVPAPRIGRRGRSTVTRGVSRRGRGKSSKGQRESHATTRTIDPGPGTTRRGRSRSNSASIVSPPLTPRYISDSPVDGGNHATAAVPSPRPGPSSRTPEWLLRNADDFVSLG